MAPAGIFLETLSGRFLRASHISHPPILTMTGCMAHRAPLIHSLPICLAKIMKYILVCGSHAPYMPACAHRLILLPVSYDLCFGQVAASSTFTGHTEPKTEHLPQRPPYQAAKFPLGSLL